MSNFISNISKFLLKVVKINYTMTKFKLTIINMHNTLYYLNANYLREDEHLARVITSSNAFSKSKKI
ncbi:hypothetical protein DERP_001528 [Dermatophagoides pteronyssinus]|uniref:Uncharacterized protein n=1 Tax=Dermatophagoides pteronyssinus TaxID=6956 RepID=A0ABQ8JEP4_DERPT|nr:hypothetical protein DERP_001528 [Dermatophagoides pteronyssinus]